MAVYILFGEERFLVERNAEELKNSFLSSSVQSLSFNNLNLLDPDNYDVIHLYNCRMVPDIKFLDSVNYVIEMDEKIVPIKNKEYTYLEFPKLKSYGNRNEVMLWILKEGERSKIDLSKVAGALFVNSGNSLRKLSSEIAKLRVLTADGDMVSPDTARSLLVFSNEITPKNIIEAICEGKTSKALAFYDRLQEDKNETGWITSYLQNFVLQILRAKYMIQMNIKDIPARLSISNYIYNLAVIPNLNKWSGNFLKESLRNLNEIEKRHKTGRNNSDYFLESEIIRLTEELQVKN